MGKMKDVAIDLLNQELQNEQLNPPPDEIDLETGKSMWVIKGYKIWAESYTQAIELLPLIESF